VEKKRKGVLGFTAKVLNEAGGAVVDLFDLTGCAVKKAGRKLKKTPKLGKKARKIVDEGLGNIKSEDKTIKNKIKEKEEKIEVLYREIGKEGVNYAEAGAPLESDVVQDLISDVKEYEKEIGRLKERIEELDAEKELKQSEILIPKRGIPKKKPQIAEHDHPLRKAMAAAIEVSLRSDVFEMPSDKAKFEKVASDLLDDEMEIKILAVAELGKMKTSAAVPVLAEAVKFEEPHLTLEIINALIDIGDSSAVKLFKDRVRDPFYRVRAACLRGLYKLAEESDRDAMRILIGTLQDEHPDVRKSGATFLGWKGNEDAVPALVQGLKDEDEKVRRAALSALAAIRDKSAVLPLIKVLRSEDIETRKRAMAAINTITGEEIVFDLQADGDELDRAVGDLNDWWQRTRLGEIEIDRDIVSDPDETGLDADIETEPPIPVDVAETEPPAPAEIEAVEPEEVEESTPPEEPEESMSPEKVEESTPPDEETKEPGLGDAEEIAAETEEPAQEEQPADDEVVEPEEEKPEPVEEVPEPEEEKPEPEEEAPEPEEEKPGIYTESELLRKLKPELVAICEGLGLDCDEKLTKSEISSLILEHNA